MLRHLSFLLFIVLAACASPVIDPGVTAGKTTVSVLNPGTWRMQLDLGDKKLPVVFNLNKNKSDQYLAEFINGSEKIVSLPFILNDSVSFRLPIFDSEFRCKITNPGKLDGMWYNLNKCCGYKIPFSASTVTHPYRFDPVLSAITPADFSGKWEVTFSKATDDQYKAIGVFEQKESVVTGTFMTETGDYRFLEGNVFGNKMWLSCFDGSHAFLFESEINSEKTINGMFYSGTHWKEPWEAKRNDKFELSNPDSLTFIKEGYSGINFSFQNLDGKLISFPSETYTDKVVILQIMGSWCPNCMDETRFLNEMYSKFHAKGLEVISLCFERSGNFEIASNNVKNHKNHLGAPWEFLIAGNANKSEAVKALPMLNHIMSFPTTIFIDKKSQVRKIHTGFYGPGTGSYYTRFVEKTEDFLIKILAE